MTRLEKDEVPAMEYTGERMVPEAADAHTYWEHLYRYKFAIGFVKGKRVLDIACGEGYGSSALTRAGASSLVGVDVSAEACEHARLKYGVDARVGDAQNIPLADDSVDVVVSFETIEHVPDPPRFLDECARVLAPGGTLIVSTPNRDLYRESMGGVENPFHCAEMNVEEFEAILKPRFKGWDMYVQVPKRARWFQPVGASLDSWPVWGVRGFRRHKFSARGALCKHIFRDLSDAERAEVDKAVLAPEPWPGGLFNPFLVRRQGALSGLDPVYLVAVARV